MTIIPNTAPLQQLLTAKVATLTISNQKNGNQGQSISHECTGQITSPVKALARQVAHIMSHTDDQSTAISTCFHPTRRPFQVKPHHINDAIKEAVVDLQMDRFGFTPNDVSSHSLRAGGAMAMKLNGIDSITIKKMGRWSSETFLRHIHEQISALFAGISTKMNNFIPFHNITSTGPTINQPPPHTINAAAP